MMLQSDKLRLIMEKYSDLYGRNVELKLNARGSGEILLDLSRGGDIYYEVLLEWDTWEQFNSKIAKFDLKSIVAEPNLVEQARPNSYYRCART